MIMNKTKKAILDAAYRITSSDYSGFAKLTRSSVAKEAGVSPELINYHWGRGLALLKAHVVERALQEEKYWIIQAAIFCGNDAARSLPKEIRQIAAVSVRV